MFMIQPVDETTRLMLEIVAYSIDLTSDSSGQLGQFTQANQRPVTQRFYPTASRPAKLQFLSMAH